MGKRFTYYTSGFSFLIDEFPNSRAAFSICRKLREAYTGSAIRVRRSSDNAEQDIGFSYNSLDTASLLTFVGANSAYVTTVYDQENNFDFTQVTASKQARIVNAGTLDTLDGKPCAKFDGLNDDFTNIRLLDTSDFSIFLVNAETDNFANSTIPISQYISGSSPQRFTLFGGRVDVNRRALLQLGGSNFSVIGTTDANRHYKDVMNNNSFATVGYDGETPTAGTIGTGSPDATSTKLGVISSLSLFTEMSFQEVVFYTMDKTSDRVEIRNNINGFYGIF